ncbi:hypothetical protein [Anaplasma phagocytophilum]|uniref:hypothetical protein n=1 Tax=Anaplasma phagocytophilum TaxID=948 RepID=UPI00200E57E4|nr:hypothetical protein [Anaplasma phagocytophilum]UQD54717.1 hypothetical protein ESP60_05640 [Anaplasma phagocytophilum]
MEVQYEKIYVLWQPWPRVRKALLEENFATIAVQVDGKFCGTLRVKLQCDGEKVKTAAVELAQRRIKERLAKNMCLDKVGIIFTII